MAIFEAVNVHRFKQRGTLPTLPVGGGLPAVHSQLVLHQFGINVQPWQTNNYTDYTRVENFLVDLGTRRLRTKLVASTSKSDAQNIADPSNQFMWKMFNDHGMKWHATLGEYDPADSDAKQLADRVAMAPVMLNFAAAFEGWGSYNEPNGQRLGPINNAWPTKCTLHQQWMDGQRDAHPVDYADVIVCGPSMHDNPPGGNASLQSDYLKCAPCAPYLDRGEMHRYPAGQLPSNGIDQRTSWMAAGIGDAKTQQITVSESGYNITPLTWDARVTQDVQASYAPRLFMEHYIRGNMFYWFDLLCQYDATQARNQDWYGIVNAPTNNNADLVPNAAFNTFKRFLAILEDGEAAFVTTPLDLVISGNPQVKAVLCQKRSGQYILILWKDTKLWDKASHSPIAATSVNTLLTFGTTRTLTKYTPKLAAGGTALGSNTAFTIPVAGDLICLTFN